MTTTRQRLLHAAKLASENYGDAKRQLAAAQTAQRLGMSVPHFMDIASREHVSYHAWRRAMEAFANS